MAITFLLILPEIAFATGRRLSHTVSRMLPRAVFLAMLALAPAWAQGDGLPPGILLLSRIKRHIREQVGRLPDYTCLQTTARFRWTAGDERTFRPDDVLMLEVLNAGDKELYASPGAREFHEENPSAFTAGGLTATGAFGLHLRTVFVNDNAMFTWRGEEEVAGRRAVRYDYRVPQMLSGYSIHRAYGRATVAMKGSFWADPQTLDLLWLEVQADEIPEKLDLASAVQIIDYERMRIGDREIVLPQSARIRMVDLSGEESRDLIEFTHCRSFTAESRLRFDTPAEPAASATTAPRPPRDVIPPGLVLTIELWSPVTGAQTVGAAIEGRVAADVRQKGKVAIPQGAVVHGRLRRLEAQEGYYAVGLEFTEIEVDGVGARFYGTIQEVEKPARFMVRNPSRGPRREMQLEEIYAGFVPGVALFLVPGKELNLPRGFKTVWKTSEPRAGR
jgi:hypothetical protein